MYCDASNCTGKHSNNLWGEMCSAARERKRVRQRAWVRSKYYNNPGWASEKRWANLYYKSTADMLGYSEQEGDSRTAAKRPTVPPNAPLKFAANTSA